MQALGNGNFLVEFERKEHAGDFIDSGIDWNDIHITCNPPQGYHINVSLLGLRAYITDDEVTKVLAPFGDLKSDVICLKYKADHDLAGLENGNRLVRMVLTKPSIPYSLKISGTWCRVIHNNQQRVCSHCHAIEHSRRNCPEIECHKCNQKGHLSYNCPTNITPRDNNTADNIANNMEQTPSQDPAGSTGNREPTTPTKDADTTPPSAAPAAQNSEDSLPAIPESTNSETDHRNKYGRPQRHTTHRKETHPHFRL